MTLSSGYVIRIAFVITFTARLKKTPVVLMLLNRSSEMLHCVDSEIFADISYRTVGSNFRVRSQKTGNFETKEILMFIGPCIILIVE
jgi:hypothetical protein